MSSHVSFAVRLSAALLIFAVGCTHTPFAPVAVPHDKTLPPSFEQIKRDPAEVKAELQALQKALPPEYTLRPGDVFAIVVDGHEELSRPQVTVLPSGSVSVAPVGYVKVIGLTFPQATRIFQEEFSKFVRNCNVVLEPVKIAPDCFAVSGMVNEPGIYPFVFGSCRIMDAIAMAKGFVCSSNEGNRFELADLANAYIVRNGKVLPVDFVEAVSKGNLLHNIPLMNGDYIHIPSLENGKIAVLGEVDDPDCFPYQPELTLLQALAYAGGLKVTHCRYVKVIRGGLKEPVVFDLDIRAIRHGETVDFKLEPRDIVFVPRDGISEWNVVIQQLLPTVQLVNGLAGPFGSPTLLYK